jgi:hypothetical protein
MATLLWIAGLLVFLAGFQLFVLTESTERAFAWTIDPPLTAAFLGASYWSSAAFEWAAARRRLWGEARIAVPAVFTFTVLTLVISLVHIDRLHFGEEFPALTQTVTWLWMAIYAAVPVIMAVLWFREQRMPGLDPPPTVRLATWLRLLLVIHALALGATGIFLLVAPETAMGAWPWSLTPLTARATGAWLTSLGVVAAHALWINSVCSLRPAGWGYLAFGVLQAVALARYAEDMAWSSAAGIAFAVFVATALLIGAGITSAGRDSSNPAPW